MKIKILTAWLASTAAVAAAPLTETTAVHPRPDAASPAISYLKAGTEPNATPDSLATAPAGWMAVELAGPFEGYVPADGLTKSLDVRVGAPIHLAPNPDAPVLTAMEKGDKAEISGFRGKWTQVHLEKKIVGYIHVAGPENAIQPAIASMPATSESVPAASAIGPERVTAAGKPAPMGAAGEASSAMLPRLIQGKFVSTKRPFTPKRPYDYQINDDAGVRVTYVDVSKLLQTEQIDKYVGHTVVVSGVAHNVPDAKGMVVEAESLQLK